MSSARPWTRLEKTLGATIAVLLAIVAVGTLVAIVSGAPARSRELEARQDSSGMEADIAPVYEGLGSIRIESADKDPALVLVKLAFPYDPSDRPFIEELDDKAPRLRAIASAFFAGKRREDLAPAFEGALKAELRDRLNASLSLGRLEELWFAAFSVLD